MVFRIYQAIFFDFHCFFFYGLLLNTNQLPLISLNFAGILYQGSFAKNSFTIFCRGESTVKGQVSKLYRKHLHIV